MATTKRNSDARTLWRRAVALVRAALTAVSESLETIAVRLFELIIVELPAVGPAVGFNASSAKHLQHPNRYHGVVVNDHVTVLIVLPAGSLAPLNVTVYLVFRASCVFGVHVAMLLALS